jgi:hypothetical protein
MGVLGEPEFAALKLWGDEGAVAANAAWNDAKTKLTKVRAEVAADAAAQEAAIAKALERSAAQSARMKARWAERKKARNAK